MGNSFCNCNNKDVGIDSNLFQPNNAGVENHNTPLNIKSFLNPTEKINSSLYSFMKFLKLQRSIRKFILMKNSNTNNKEVVEYGSNYKDPLKKSGFDDKNFSYNGELDENGNKQGFGLQKWKDGALYKGYFYENKANFLGIFNHSDGDVFEGEFKNDRAYGYGKYLHSNGALYEGEWVDDSQHGTGIEVWADKSQYRGDYIRGKKCGTGSYQWSDGSSYDGEWYENTLHGKVNFYLREFMCLLIKEYILENG